jgi:type IV pilus assembly protein PilM
MLNFGTKYPIGIAIGDHNLYAAQLKTVGKGFVIEGLFHREVAESIAEADPGDEKVIALFKEVAKNHHFSGKRVVISLPPRDEIAFPIRFKVETDESLEEAIVRESSEHLTFPLEDAVLDYPSISPESPDSTDRFRATVVAVQKERVNSYMDMLKRAKLNVDAVDFRVSALIRLHHQAFKPSNDIAVLCNIGHFQTQLTFLTKDSILGQRNISWGIQTLHDRILTNLPSLKDKSKTTILLKTHGLAYEKRTSDNPSEAAERDVAIDNLRRTLYQILSPSIDELVFEFHKMISYIRAEQQQVAFDGIYIYGQAASIAHLDSYFERHLNIPTKRVNPVRAMGISNVNTLPLGSAEAPYAVALGLAMRKIPWL